jgi:hypothetical protein
MNNPINDLMFTLKTWAAYVFTPYDIAQYGLRTSFWYVLNWGYHLEEHYARKRNGRV